MAVPPIVLNRKQVLLTITDSRSGIVITTLGYNFGIVEMVYDTGDYAKVGSTIMFMPEDAVEMMYGSTVYYLIDEEKIKFKEP